ncbi:MAG: type II toxin-antitoxin system VapC family toxin [Cyanobacteria bacterium J06597_16]
MKVVLDTCALIWWSLDPERLSGAAEQACAQMEKEKNGVVSSISIWEIAIKVKSKRLDLGVDLTGYFAALKRSNVIQILPVEADLWVESVNLDWAHRDPADRVVVALAKSCRASIITADKQIRDFYSDVVW